MNPRRFARVKAVFLEALRMPPAGRAALVRRRCGGDRDLESAVAELLRLHAEPDSIVDVPALGAGFAVPAPDLLPPADPPLRRGSTLGSYRLLEPVAEGGMGIVYRAEQARPRRLVAVKVLKSTDTAASLVERFGDEAEYLGRLQHPGIAQVFEAGTANAGGSSRPFIAMEWIDGEPLDRHGARSTVGVEARVRLLVEVADAVAHAHDRGVLHGDLKPSNVLVDARARAKIIDFGVAVTLDEARPIRRAGTVPYLAPELLAESGRAPDPRSDVYALGVVAYELLGSRRVGDDALTTKRTALELGPVAGARWRDLAAIVRTATAPRPADRYARMADLAADLRRYLADESLAVRERGPGGRLWRWLCRHPYRAALLALCAAFAVMAVGFRSEARSQRAGADRAAGHLLRALSASAPGSEAELGALLAHLEREADRTATSRPRDSVALQSKLAWLDYRHGRLEMAHDRAAKALATSLAALGDADPATLETRVVLGQVLLARGDLRAAETQLDAVLARAPASASADPQRLEAQLALSRVFEAWGRLAEARGLLRDCLATTDTDPLATASREHARAKLQEMIGSGQGDGPRLVTLYRRAAQLCRRLLGPDHPRTLAAGNDLGVELCRSPATVTDGLELLRSLHERCCRVHGARHHETLRIHHDLAFAHAAAGDFEAAVRIQERVWELRREVLGERHLDTLRSLNNLARFCARSGDRRQAAALFAELAQIGVCALPENNWFRGMFCVNYGGFLHEEGEFERSLHWLRQGIASLTAGRDRIVSPRLRRYVLDARASFALTLLRRGDTGSALDILEDVHAERERVMGAADPETVASADRLAKVLCEAGRYDRAEPMARAVLDRRRARLGEEHRQTIDCTNTLAVILRRRGATAEAEELLRRSLRVVGGAAGSSRLACHLAVCLHERGELEEALATCRQVLEGLDAGSTGGASDRAQAFAVLGDILMKVGDWSGAADAYRRCLTRWRRQLGPRSAEVGRLERNLALALSRDR